MRIGIGIMSNNKKVFRPLGVNMNKSRALDDFYATDPTAIDYLLKYESFDRNVWECACGNGNLSKRLEDYGYNVLSTDLVYRGFGGGKLTF